MSREELITECRKPAAKALALSRRISKSCYVIIEMGVTTLVGILRYVSVAQQSAPLLSSRICISSRNGHTQSNIKTPEPQTKQPIKMNRGLSIRSKKKEHGKEPSKHTFSMATLRGMNQADLSKKLFKVIKTESHAIGAYESAGRERLSIATQISDWGESTNDDSISDISDKLGVIMSEIGEQEDIFAQNLEDYRSILKQIRNTEASVQPSRDNKAKTTDEIQKLKYKDPSSPKLVTLEQELVRAEAQNLVAEAQLTNITRQKLKEAYDIHFAATIERAEKQIILAKYGRRLLNYLDDAPVVPGDERQPFAHANEARQVLNDCEQELQSWQPHLEPVNSAAGSLGTNLMPTEERENLRSPMSTKDSEFEDAPTLHHPEDTTETVVEPTTEVKSSTEPVRS